MLKTLLFGVFLSVGGSGICSASALYLTATGTFSTTDIPDTFVVPGDTFSLVFTVNSSPLTSNTSSLSFDVAVDNFVYELNGVPLAVPQPAEITFYASPGAGVEVQFANSSEFTFGNSQYFSGTTAAPSFSAGTFTGESFMLFDPSNFDANAATVTLTPTPEPSSVHLLLCGCIGLLAVGFRKSARFS